MHFSKLFTATGDSGRPSRALASNPGLFSNGREDAARIVDEVRQSFSKMEFQAGQQSFSLTFSAGISLYPGNQSVSV